VKRQPIVRTAEEVSIQRERAAVLGYTYIDYLSPILIYYENRNFISKTRLTFQQLR
jgi:hypothetical protein